jgi:hypothetical protein
MSIAVLSLNLVHVRCACGLVLPLQSVVDAAEQKAQFDTQLDKANADAWEMKAAFDKVGM